MDTTYREGAELVNGASRAASPFYAATYDSGTIVTVESHSWRGPAYDVVIDGFEVFSVPDSSGWSKSDWDTIVNNTVLDLNPGNPGPPWIAIVPHKDKTPSRDSLVRNNLATDLDVSGDNVVEDHNMILPEDMAGYFVDLVHHDVRLAEGSPAIDKGSADGAPAADADAIPRPQGASVDLGAYEFAPGISRPDGGFAGPTSGFPGTKEADGPATGCGCSGGGALWPAVALSLAAWSLCLRRRRENQQ